MRDKSLEITVRKSSSIQLIKKFAPYYKKYIPVVILDLFCAALTTVCELVLPLIVRYITNLGMNDLAALTVKTVFTMGAAYMFMRIVDAVANYYMTAVGHIMGTRIETDMRRDLFAHLQKLEFSYYDDTKVGTIMSRITTDLFEVTEFAHHCPEEFFIAAVKIIGAFIILLNMSVPLTLMMFSVIPVMAVVLSHYNQKLRAGFRESRVKIGELNSAVEDSLLGIRVVKSFANEGVEEEKFGEGNTAFLNIKKKIYKAMAAFHSVTRVFDGLMYIIVVCAGAVLMIKHRLEPADLVAYLMYATTLLNSIRRIVEFTEQFQRGMTGIERFEEIMETEPRIKDSEGAGELTGVKGNIEFHDVSFRYSEKLDEVLSHVNLTVGAGESAAFAGPSGGGKTTLCNLIPRFYELTAGSITIDGTDIRDVTLSSLRSNIGVVQQDVYLFSGSVRDNIEYGKPGASDEEIINAARLAGADEFISRLPNGYDTYVGERGVKLSGGQKQRISIARVFLKDPPILILDEATSALDNESERLVQHSLEQLAKGRTTLTVAHRLTTIKGADMIYVVTEDGITEQGTHGELLEKNGMYAAMYNE